MQMLAHYQINDFASFKTAFDSDAEDRGNNGLSVLQLWREDGGSVWALFSINDQAKAKDYLNGAAGVFHSQAGVTGTSFHFVETA